MTHEESCMGSPNSTPYNLYIVSEVFNEKPNIVIYLPCHRRTLDM